MDTTDENNMEDMKMEIQSNQTLDKDFLARSDEGHQQLTISEGSSSSCRKVWVRSRPKLHKTKSFPPYSQCIGGLGDNGEPDTDINCESNSYQLPLRHDETETGDGRTVIQSAERKDIALIPRCAGEEVKFKWRMMRLGGSYEVDPDGWERGRWSGKRRVGETGKDPCEHGDKGREEGTNSEWKHCRSENTSLETETREEEDEQRSWACVSATEGECAGSGETLKDEGAGELTSVRKGSTAHQPPSPHPILSKILYSSSSTSSSNLSSPESDDVFSEEEDVSKKRKTLRKVRKAPVKGQRQVRHQTVPWHRRRVSGSSGFPWKV